MSSALYKFMESYSLLLKIGKTDSCVEIRKNAMIAGSGFIKNAFDTRNIDSVEQYNPRRNLQNFVRSEAFISEATSDKIKLFNKLRSVLERIEAEFGKNNRWFDSYARVLLQTLNSALRKDIGDTDVVDFQPGVGNLNYIQELLYTRYRLSIEDLESISDDDLRKRLLEKDEELIGRNSINISKDEIGKEKSYDSLLDKLFNGVKATKDNPSVQRSVTITITDSFLDDKK